MSGIGNFMTYSLSTLGLAALTFIYEDKIEESNPNRQFLFSYNDIRSGKVDIIKEKIKSLNKVIQTKSYKEKVLVKLLENIFTNSKIKPSLIVLLADYDYCLPLVNKFCIENSISLINIGYFNDFSVIGPFYISNISSYYYRTDIGVIKKSSSSKLESKIILVNKDHQAPFSLLVMQLYEIVIIKMLSIRVIILKLVFVNPVLNSNSNLSLTMIVLYL